MLSRGEAITHAREHARRLHHRFGVRAPEHLRISAFAAHFGTSVVESSLDGAKAQLVRCGQQAQIVLSQHITDLGTRRFSVAHELGHLLLGHPTRPVGLQTVANDERDLEREADAFAAELLMPTALLRARCCEGPMGLHVPWEIAREYRVSVLAAAIRFAELTSESCAAVLTDCHRVRWAAASTAWPHAIPRGRPVAQGSLAERFFASGTLPTEPHEVQASSWLVCETNVRLMEQAIASPEAGTVLSMLWPVGAERVPSSERNP